MKTILSARRRYASILLAVGGISLPAVLSLHAQPADGQGGMNRPPRPSQEEILARFDADGDGVLSDSEKEAAREAMRGQRPGGPGRAAMRNRVIEAFDEDGDGKLNETERTAARAAAQERAPAVRARAMQRFDANGDGQLDETERATMRAEIQAHHANRPGAGVGGPEGERPKPRAQQGQGGDRPRPNAGQGQGGQNRLTPEERQARLAEFDKDGDGKLSEEERATMRAAMQARRAQGNAPAATP